MAFQVYPTYIGFGEDRDRKSYVDVDYLADPQIADDFKQYLYILTWQDRNTTIAKRFIKEYFRTSVQKFGMDLEPRGLVRGALVPFLKAISALNCFF